ncbi:MAG: metal-sulfur cluster assembly factor [Lactobacillales bacterium]|jgi:metal-sulfur cluster biosynthetic enzyme|nr:metal-sulfur cluster assembly factor [Lactobacillales bacterium]
MKERIKETVLANLETVIDPEMGMDIVNLGLIYDVDVNDDGFVKVTMTLTSIGCPMAEMILEEVQKSLQGITGVTGMDVELVFQPPWGVDKMSRYARIALGVAL